MLQLFCRLLGAINTTAIIKTEANHNFDTTVVGAKVLFVAFLGLLGAEPVGVHDLDDKRWAAEQVGTVLWEVNSDIKCQVDSWGTVVVSNFDGKGKGAPQKLFRSSVFIDRFMIWS